MTPLPSGIVAKAIPAPTPHATPIAAPTRIHQRDFHVMIDSFDGTRGHSTSGVDHRFYLQPETRRRAEDCLIEFGGCDGWDRRSRRKAGTPM
jgi:hypothetical protein